MRLCRIGPETRPQIAFYDERRIVPFADAAEAFVKRSGQGIELPPYASLLDFLPPNGPEYLSARRVAKWLDEQPTIPGQLDPAKVELLVPIPRPNKIFLLAGNYAEHIREGGGIAAERAETFPYVFMKPPSTTLNHPSRPIRIPKIAPNAVDWELELAVIIGTKCKGVSEAQALRHVAGYTIINDISQRKFRPNPDRKKRERDAFFDWLHGKWFDTFCCISAVVTSADSIPDPQNLRMRLEVNGEVQQDASTAQMIFPVAAVIAFISQICTLEPGDLISTGTPAGVGHTTATYLKPGDFMRGWIEGIGTVENPVEMEK
jgi:2-keto-4-pentenoate hydratase/2-oxohepta-3-ene-1,7-dioic acid hydratase in catechol pathway